jgi:hypothetical protein
MQRSPSRMNPHLELELLLKLGRIQLHAIGTQIEWHIWTRWRCTLQQPNKEFLPEVARLNPIFVDFVLIWFATYSCQSIFNQTQSFEGDKTIILIVPYIFVFIQAIHVFISRFWRRDNYSWLCNTSISLTVLLLAIDEDFSAILFLNRHAISAR